MQYKTTLQSFPNVSLDGLQGPIALSKTSTGVDLLFFQNSAVRRLSTAHSSLTDFFSELLKAMPNKFLVSSIVDRATGTVVIVSAYC